MLKASKQYKEMMNSPIRQRGYVSVSLGVVNQSAQGDATTEFGNVEYYSSGSVFETGSSEYITYATLEDNFIKADGELYFAPENDELAQFKNNGVTVSEFNSDLRLNFGKEYDLKGITIQFAPNGFPTEFSIESKNGTFNYSNDNSKFVTDDVFGVTDYLIIKPVTFNGEHQRWHIQNILFGVGFIFTNSTTENVEIEDYVSAISDEVSYSNYRISVFDSDKKFDVDNSESYMSYLEPMQPIGISFGVDLEDGTQEWLQVATGYLKEWNSQNGKLTLIATDRLSQLESEYALGNVIQERSAYSEFEKIFLDCGLEQDEFSIDDFLYSYMITNPIEPMPHREALQLLANVTRCVIYENENGIINVKANFGTTIDPEDLEITATNEAEWSAIRNTIASEEVINYSDMSFNSIKANGTTYFMPEDSNYLDTGYVSNEIADENGHFNSNPTVTISLPALYSYYEVSLSFGGSVPKKLKVYTYSGNTLLNTFEHEDLTSECVLLDNFTRFNKIVFEFIECEPYSRVQLNKIKFGYQTDYFLTKDLMLDNPIGTMDEIVKEIKVKIHTYELKDGEPKLVEDEVYYTYPLNVKGVTKTCENPLVSSEAQAMVLAEWLGNYYKNNVLYSIEYRGEPRVQASDIIHVENDYKNNMQIEVQTARLEYNGAFAGQLECRRALKNSYE